MKIREIDQVSVTVLVDNYTDLLRTDNSSLIKRPSLPERTVLLGEHGLSLFITIRSGETRTYVLMDAGASDISLMYNASRLGVDLNTLSSVIISHGHDDHVGSLEAVARSLNRSVMVHIHPVAFSRRRKVLPDGQTEVLPPDREGLEKAGISFHPTPEPTPIESGTILVTGEIERSTPFERIPPYYQVEDEGSWIADTFLDDQAVIIHLRNKGLIVITGCAHSGIINTVQYAKKITGVEEVHAVIGGFHLSGSFFRPAIKSTIALMQEINPAYIIPLHCTGWEAMIGFAEKMPGQFILNTVGTRYQFG